MSKRKKRLIVLMATVAIAAGAFALYAGLLGPYLQSTRLERLLAAFKAGPSDATAKPLLALLEAGKPTQEEGTAILELLLEPHVEIPQPWAAGKAITILIRSKHNLRDGSGLFILHNTSISVTDGDANYSAENSDSLVVGPPWAGRGALIIDRPGVYTGHLELEYSLFSIDPIKLSTEFPIPFITPPPARSLWRQALDLPKEMWAKLTAIFDSHPPTLVGYSCAFKVPVRIHVVSSEDAATAPATRPGSEGDQQ